MTEAFECKEFYANCDHMPGKERALRVGGKVVCPTNGWSVRLAPHERPGSPPISPLTLELDLVFSEPSEGNEVFTDTPVDELVMIEPTIEYYEVHIYGDGEHGEGPGTIKVIHTE